MSLQTPPNGIGGGIARQERFLAAKPIDPSNPDQTHDDEKARKIQSLAFQNDEEQAHPAYRQSHESLEDDNAAGETRFPFTPSSNSVNDKLNEKAQPLHSNANNIQAAVVTATPGGQPPKEPNVIDFDDLEGSKNPMNWSSGKKKTVSVVMALLTLSTTFTSSMFSTASIATAKEFHVGQEVTVLGLSLYVLGFAFGPIIFGPFSELFGRRVPLLTGVFGMCCFQIGVSVAQNLYTIMICRFFAGLFGCAPLSIVAGAIADFYGPVERGVAQGLFAMMTFVGPLLAPVIGGFIADSYLGWRWTEWITVIFGFFAFFLGLILLPESYAPLILSNEAKRLRLETGNWALHAKSDETKIDGQIIAQKYLLRPFKMIWQEPILILITLYMGLVYGILYLFFEAFPISFSEDRGWNEGVGALPFISVMIGIFFGGGFIGWWSKNVYFQKLAATNGRVVPEERLPPMILGGICMTVGLFWWGWSSYPDVHKLWVSQLFAGVPAGAGIILVFVQGLNYMVDCYKWYANSAIAASTFFRSWLGAGFPLFATAMYHQLGVPWATSVLAFCCLGLLPAPVLFWKFGAKIRAKSKFVPQV